MKRFSTYFWLCCMMFFINSSNYNFFLNYFFDIAFINFCFYICIIFIKNKKIFCCIYNKWYVFFFFVSLYNFVILDLLFISLCMFSSILANFFVWIIYIKYKINIFYFAVMSIFFDYIFYFHCDDKFFMLIIIFISSSFFSPLKSSFYALAISNTCPKLAINLIIYFIIYINVKQISIELVNCNFL